MITLSIIKADTGGFVGHSAVHPDMLAEASRAIQRAIQSGYSSMGRSPAAETTYR